MLVEPIDEGEGVRLLGYGVDDRWYVLDEPTSDPLLILAVMLGCDEVFEA